MNYANTIRFLRSHAPQQLRTDAELDRWVTQQLLDWGHWGALEEHLTEVNKKYE